MIQIPPNLAALAAITSDPDDVGHTRTDCVRLVMTPTGYLAEATDGRTAVIVEGDCKPPDGPVTITEILVPATVLATVLGIDYPQGLVDVTFGKKGATLSVAHNSAVGVFAVPKPEQEKPFPEVNSVIPKTAPLAVVRLNAKLLAKLVAAARGICGTDDECCEVVLEVRAPNQPVIVRCRRDDVKFTGLVMPLVKDEKS